MKNGKNVQGGEIITCSFKLSNGRKTRLVPGDRAIFYKEFKIIIIQRSDAQNLILENFDDINELDKFWVAVKYMAAATELAYKVIFDDESQIMIEYYSPLEGKKKK